MGLATQYQILLGYSIFLMAYLGISAGIGVTYLTGNTPQPQQIRCDYGFVIIDGLLNCMINYMGLIFNFFSFSSAIGIFNTVIVVPYLIFVTYLIIVTLRGST